MVTRSTAVPVITTERELSYYDEHLKTGSCVWFVPQKQNRLCLTLSALVQETVHFRCKSHWSSFTHHDFLIRETTTRDMSFTYIYLLIRHWLQLACILFTALYEWLHIVRMEVCNLSLTPLSSWSQASSGCKWYLQSSGMLRSVYW